MKCEGGCAVRVSDWKHLGFWMLGKCVFIQFVWPYSENQRWVSYSTILILWSLYSGGETTRQPDSHLPYWTDLTEHLRLIVILIIVLFTIAVEFLFGLRRMVSRTPMVYSRLPFYFTDINRISIFLSICWSTEGVGAEEQGDGQAIRQKNTQSACWRFRTSFGFFQKTVHQFSFCCAKAR